MNMKKLALLIFAVVASVALNAQELKSSEVPQSFTEGLLKVYPTATDIKWDKRGTDYKVKFNVGSLGHEIWFNREGKMVKVDRNITQAEIPVKVMEIIKRDYPDYKIDSVESVEKDGRVSYVIELEKSWNESILITFNTQGQIIRALRE